MTFLLLLAPNMSERQRAGLHRRLAEAFPELTIERAASAAEAEPHIARADILMAYNIPDELAAKARSLRWIQSLASGTDGFLSRPSLPKAPTITRMQNVAAVPVSEGAVALMLALAHRLPTALQAAVPASSRIG